MHRVALLFAVIVALLAMPGVSAQEPVPSAATEPKAASTPAGSAPASASQDAAPLNLPIDVNRIRRALERPPLLSVQLSRDQPTFRIEVQERNRFQEILATLDFKGGPTPAGGLYQAEMQRVMFPAVDYPLRQPYSAFSQPELLTIIIENIVGKYLAGKALTAITAAQRAAAEAAAKDELRRAVGQYCAAQPNHGAGIKICMDQEQ